MTYSIIIFGKTTRGLSLSPTIELCVFGFMGKRGALCGDNTICIVITGWLSCMNNHIILQNLDPVKIENLSTTGNILCSALINQTKPVRLGNSVGQTGWLITGSPLKTVQGRQRFFLVTPSYPHWQLDRLNIDVGDVLTHCMEQYVCEVICWSRIYLSFAIDHKNWLFTADLAKLGELMGEKNDWAAFY